jgi:hypothetical protein
MSRNGSIDLEWADGGPYTFRLAIGQLRELQETINKPRVKLGAPFIGPATLYNMLVCRDAWLHEVREVMRLGLIGGGTSPEDARDLVQRYVEERPLAESSVHAALVLGAALFGTPEEELDEGKEMPASQDQAASASPASTDGALS